VYGKAVSINTLDGQSVLTTSPVTSITATSAASGGNITSDGGAAITARGIVWSTSQNPTLPTDEEDVKVLKNGTADKIPSRKPKSKEEDAIDDKNHDKGYTVDGEGTGEFTSQLADLTPSSTYYVRAYATNDAGIQYGDEQTFTTNDGLPEVTTAEITNINATSATSGGNITDDGDFAITARGVCYSTTHNPTTADNTTSDGTGSGSFTSELTGLDLGTAYYVRAYAINEAGTAYGVEKEFTTSDGSIQISTTDITNITATAATSGGHITDDGGSAITARGVCYSTLPNPTVTDNTTTDGTGTGSFASELSELELNTTYYVRAYATNEAGTQYGDEQTFTTNDGLPEVNTADIINITATSATSGGNITDDGGFAITARGVCYSTSPNPTTADNPTTDGTGSGTFASQLTGLNLATTYYVRAYATNEAGTAYGVQKEFTTSDGSIQITTAEITDITATAATSGGHITDDGGSAITARGVCYSTLPNPTVTDNTTTDGTGTGSFASELSELELNTTYYVRAYATNEAGTAYGDEKEFTTEDGLPEVATAEITNITATAATSGGNITNDGGFAITARGVCYSTSPDPTTSDNTTSNGTGTGSFTSDLTGLDLGTTYYVRAYATNEAGTAYGVEKEFTTSDGSIQITTAEITSITTTSATSGGHIIDDGGFAITARGICYSTSSNPTTSDNTTSDGIGTGSFTSELTGLDLGTTYYIRAYATNEVGTQYGDEHIFTTNDGSPGVTTANITGITATSATSGGHIAYDGGFAISARGVCYSTSPNPTTSDNTTSDGTGSGSFTSQLTGLNLATTYYVRAYAVNEMGTAYGVVKVFTTRDGNLQITTTEITNITATAATSGGHIVDDGGFAITARGVCYSTSPNPTTSDNTTSDGTGTGSFTSELKGLELSTTYYVRAYACNDAGTQYGDEQIFTTNDGLPEVNTADITNITATAATSGGNITDDGCFAITARGVCYSTSPNPTTADNPTTDGTGSGSFTSDLTGLSLATTYYVRAYAINDAGIQYGDQQVFTTKDGLPEVATANTTGVTATSATSGGHITDDGGFAITARGVCYSTSPDPITSDNTTSDGTGTGSFTSELTGLNLGTTYYVRAYATNEVGTAYGEEIDYTTPDEGEVINPITGQIWMDRNLGATRVANSSTDYQAYGDLYQWGRGTDGHEKRDSPTTLNQSSSDSPGHGNFIKSNADWRSPRNDNLWQGVSGTNNPCPVGFRLPTEAEWIAEMASWNSEDAEGAFASPLKLPMAGFRDYTDGSLTYMGSTGEYWSSTVDGSSSRYLYIAGYSDMFSYYRASGYSVRCIRD
jgi:uncharacterized protein (TIGR02145 family)